MRTRKTEATGRGLVWAAAGIGAGLGLSLVTLDCSLDDREMSSGRALDGGTVDARTEASSERFEGGAGGSVGADAGLGSSDGRATDSDGAAKSDGMLGSGGGGGSAGGGSTDAGAAGVAGSSGNAGGGADASDAGGTAACKQPATTGIERIDDMEDGNTTFANGGAIHGSWSIVRDAIDAGAVTTAPIEMLNEARGSSLYGLHFAGSGFSGTERWASLQASLSQDKGTTTPYDASSYVGIRFYARGSGAVQFKVQTSATVPSESGGTCRPTGTSDCYDDFSKDIELQQSQWTQYTVLFCELSQSGWGVPATFDPKTILRLTFDPGRRNGETPESWDLWIDDVSFIKSSSVATKLTLPPQNGRVESSSNDVGVHGDWFTWSDGKSTIQTVVDTGKICLSGSTSPAESGVWGAFVALPLNQVPNLHRLYDAPANGVTGVQYTVTGATMPSRLQVGLHLPSAGNSEASGNDFLDYCVQQQIAANTPTTLRFADTKLNCYDSPVDAGSLDPTRLELLYFDVPSTTGVQPFDFCISDLTAITP